MCTRDALIIINIFLAIFHYLWRKIYSGHGKNTFFHIKRFVITGEKINRAYAVWKWWRKTCLDFGRTEISRNGLSFVLPRPSLLNHIALRHIFVIRLLICSSFSKAFIFYYVSKYLPEHLKTPIETDSFLTRQAHPCTYKHSQTHRE